MIRSFLRHAGSRGWCSPSLADAIDGPRIYTHETLPSGPSWAEVGRLLSSLETERPLDIRDRAIIRLFAIYGLRAHEVSRLRLEDIDWERGRLKVPERKAGHSTAYPLSPIVGEAIIDYLKHGRPQRADRHLFYRVMAPFDPMTYGAVSTRASYYLHKAGIPVPRPGSHTLRHTCVQRLVDAHFPLKTIGDYVGHASPESTAIYAKVSLENLREVALGDGEEVV